jgi:type I restriction enzyme, R subunit
VSGFTESVLEQATLVWLENLGYEIVYGASITPGELNAERDDYHTVILETRLRASLERLNRNASSEVIEEAIRMVSRVSMGSLVASNREFHRMLVDGVTVPVIHDGEERGEIVRLLDFDLAGMNEFAAVNQFTVLGSVGANTVERRPDVVIFVNGLPIGVIELKSATDERATIWKAWQQLTNYQTQIPQLFTFNELMVVSDGNDARVGCLHAPKERFLPWKSISEGVTAPRDMFQLEVLLRGLFDKERLLEFIRFFVVFEDDGATLQKKIAAYHQFYAVQKAMRAVREATGEGGSRRGGVVWHTQGSGKSLTMVFFVAKLVREPALENPTIVMLTDRIDLDNQLFGVFSRCQRALRQPPTQADSKDSLEGLLKVASGGVVFTTIQKFFMDQEERFLPFDELSDRRNIVVIADEAHRSQYDFIDGYARRIREALPNATFVGFTGTPLELEDRDTRNVFGDYVDVYDIERAVSDGATVRIYFESRLARLELPDERRPKLDEDFEDVTEREEVAKKEQLKSRWAKLEALVGAKERLSQVARDLIIHFETRDELQPQPGKAMIVCTSRRICVELYQEIVALRPTWHSNSDEDGAIKVVMTGSSSDEATWQTHVRSKSERERIGQRFKNEHDPLKIAIVRDMWLTGFDVPAMHTMYLDKPMKGHALMQAIARVNRVFKDKTGGLIVDYLGLSNNLKMALASYVEGSGKGEVKIDQDRAIDEMREALEVCKAKMHGFDYRVFFTGTPLQRASLLPSAQEFVRQKDRTESGFLEQFLGATLQLIRLFTLSVPREEALEIRDEVMFFQAIRIGIQKLRVSSGTPDETLDFQVRQLVDAAIAPEGVIDVFAAAGLPKPDISILSDGFLAEIRDMPHKNLAVALLERLMFDEIRTRTNKNLVQAKAFSEKLTEALRKYHNRAIETAQVIEELLNIAREMREQQARGEKLNLSEEEIAFYDSVRLNDSAVEFMDDEILRTIARDLAKTVQDNVSIDWAVRESVRANMRRMVKRVLRKHGYPPDKQDEATLLVIDQAEQLSQYAVPAY